MQSSMVFWQLSSAHIPHFIILVYLFITPPLILFPHAFHVLLLVLFHVLHPQTLTLFHSTLHHIPAMPQVTFGAPAELQIWHTVFHGLLAWLSSAHIPPLYHSCLFVHIPDPVPVPSHVSCSVTHFILCPRSPIPISEPQTLIPILFHFTLHSLCSISVPIIASDPMPISHDPDMFSLIFICSELHVCFLSLKLT